MKKVFLIFLVVLMALALVACKQEQKDNGGGAVDDGDELPMTAAEGEAKLIEQGSSGKDIDHTGFRFQLTITMPGETEESEDVTLLDIGGIKDIFWVSEILEDANGDDLVNFSDVAASNTCIFRQGESSAELYVPAEAETPATWKSIPFSINE